MINLFCVSASNPNGDKFAEQYVMAETAEEAAVIYNRKDLELFSKRRLLLVRAGCFFTVWPCAHNLAEKGCIEFDLTKQQIFPFNPDWIQ